MRAQYLPANDIRIIPKIKYYDEYPDKFKIGNDN